MAGPGICVLCLADTCTSEMHPVFNPVAPYGYLLSDMYLFSLLMLFLCVILHTMSLGYLLSDMYLFMADITNPDFLV